jgi:hypothetical protein
MGLSAQDEMIHPDHQAVGLPGDRRTVTMKHCPI